MEPLSAPHAIALVAHLLLFVYWLGADVGVFYSSGFVVNPGLTREARLTAVRRRLPQARDDRRERRRQSPDAGEPREGPAPGLTIRAGLLAEAVPVVVRPGAGG